MSYPKLTVAALLAATAFSQASELFSDSFDRPDNRNIDGSLTGIVDNTGSALAVNGVYSQPHVDPVYESTGSVDGDPANGGGADITGGQLRLAVGAGTSCAFINHNFVNAAILSEGGFTVSMDVTAYPGTARQNGGGFAIGMSASEAASAGDAFNISNPCMTGAYNGDPYGVTGNPVAPGVIVSDFWIGIRGNNSLAWGSSTGNVLGVPAGGLTNKTGTISVNFSVNDFNAGSTVYYEVFYNGVSQGTGSFQWSGNNENHIGLDARDGTAVSIDNLSISTTNISFATEVDLEVTPGIVGENTPSSEVQLSFSTFNLPPGATYAIVADKAVTYPFGGDTGPADSPSLPVVAEVDGTLGDVTFTIYISNSVPALVASDSVTVVAVQETLPNVIVILADDTGWSDYGCYGSFIQTPTIDSLAASGLRFREFYQGSRCSPTRCSILTGLYPHQAAVDPGDPLPNLRTDNNVTLAELLGANGYRTYMSGKWHLGGIGSGRDPVSRGFEHVFGQGANADGANTTDAFGYWDSSLYSMVSGEIPQRNYATQFHYSDAIGDYSVDFINHNFITNGGDKPFFLYMAFNAPHWPVCAPAALANKYTDVGDPTPGDIDVVRYEDGWDVLRAMTHSNMLAAGIINSNFLLSFKSDHPSPVSPIDDWNTLTQAQRNDLARRMAVYAAMIEQVDQNIGKVVNRLQALGQLDNTLILLVNDNGANYEGGEFGNSTSSSFTPWAAADLPHMGQPQNANNTGYPRVNQGGAWANLSNTPFRLFKHFTHNGGSRTPMIVHWPAGMTNSVHGTWTDERGHLIDIMATILDATGIPYPDNFEGHAVLPLEGTSLIPTFAGQALPSRDIALEHESNRAYFSGNWKLVTKNFSLSDGSSPADELELYDMVADPCEVNNLALDEPAVLAQLIDAWNAWATRVGVPSTRLILPPPPQVDPAPMTNDLFVDTFGRADNTDADASADGMWGSRVPPMGAGATYYESFGADRIDVESDTLRMAVSSDGMSENGLMHNFIGQEILDAGGFSVQLRVDAISSASSDPDRYVGFGVGLTQGEAAVSDDINDSFPPVSFRGMVGNPVGTADFFIELDIQGNVKSWIKGLPLATSPVGIAQGTLLACFELDGFATTDTVTVTAYFNGQMLDLDPLGAGTTASFTWDNNNANYIGLSARASEFTRMDNLAVRTLPLSYALASEYALAAGLSGTDAALDANPDTDRDNNLVEWLKGGTPAAADDERRLFRIGPSSAGDYRFNRVRLVDAAKVGVFYSFDYSTNLVDWLSFTPEPIAVEADLPGYEAVQERVPGLVATNNNPIFVRMRTTGPTP